MNKQVFNPYLPSYEYVPDGEPYVFDGRVYVYGSHDRFNGPFFCMNDYVCWSAPEDDLSDWHYEGVIYKKTQDPMNKAGFHCLYAPDVAKGTDGRFYLYYALGFTGIMSVAVCDTPAGEYKFLDYVHFKDGRVWGKQNGDPFPFDPGVLVDDDGKVYLYSGFAPRKALPFIATSFRKYEMNGGYVLELQKDMVTIEKKPKLIFNKVGNANGTSFENHEFFEASSIRKIGKKYYFIYSSWHNHELCYAVSDIPDGDFSFKGTIISNGDLFLKGNEDEKHAMNYIGNNHGSIVKIKDKWYVFYHRQTNRHTYSRQGMAEHIDILEDGSIPQAEMTSCGLNGGPLKGIGKYEAYIACNLMSYNGTRRCDSIFSKQLLHKHPYFTQNGKDRNEKPEQYIKNMRSGSIAGFKYFDIGLLNKIVVTVSGNAEGSMIVSDRLDFSKTVAEIKICCKSSNKTKFKAKCSIEPGIHPLFFKFKGKGKVDFYSFELIGNCV